MKRQIYFNIIALCLLCAFISLLYFDKLQVATLWWHVVNWLADFSAACLVIFLALSRRRYKKLKAAQATPEYLEANLKAKANLVNNKNLIGWLIASMFIFIGCMHLILYADLSINATILLVTGSTVLYAAGVTIASWLFRKNSKLKLEKAKQEQETVNLKLKSIRSQLNPHFMFNALTSIQNLMNKNDVPAANHYLGLFADLTRKVLNTSEQELISLTDELQIQEDYLQMEQLRFGFKYEVKVDEAINIANTEIPAMLLQPFVENAVKHGVAALQQNGVIAIHINKQMNDLTLSVTDNGKGFNRTAVQNNAKGYGLKLSEERITLLNQLFKDQAVTLDINSNETGTQITLTLVNLLA